MRNVLFSNPVAGVTIDSRALVAWDKTARSLASAAIVRNAFAQGGDGVIDNLQKVLAAHCAGAAAVEQLDEQAQKRSVGRPPKYSDAVREAQAAQIVKIISEQGEVGFREIADKMNVEITDLRPALKMALASGRVVQKGTRRGATYKAAA